MVEPEYHSGFVAVLGRPNVGKSTLVNALLGVKLSITSRRPQTTRDRILGIKTRDDGQIVLLDTPGIHVGESRALNRYMNRAATGALEGVDLSVLVVEAGRWTQADEVVLERMRASTAPCILVVNKVDLVPRKEKLLPYLAELGSKLNFVDIVPMSARRQRDSDRLADVLVKFLPQAPAVYPEDQYTDRSERFLCAEIVREKLIRQLGQEIPHRLAVEIEAFKRQGKNVQIAARIWVESRGQKIIVIGKKGELIKRAGIEARQDIEHLLDAHVNIELWVKVRSGWSDDSRFMLGLGYNDE
ncbi:MAG: GTP-binding protein Era [Gammaproteobacteria bacterium]